MNDLLRYLTESKFSKQTRLFVFIIFFLLLCFDSFLVLLDLLGYNTVDKTIPIVLNLNLGISTLALIAFIQKNRETIQKNDVFREIITNWEKSHANYNSVRLFGEFKQLLLSIYEKKITTSNVKEFKTAIQEELPDAFWSTQYETAYSAIISLSIVKNRELNLKRLKEILEIEYKDLMK